MNLRRSRLAGLRENLLRLGAKAVLQAAQRQAEPAVAVTHPRLHGIARGSAMQEVAHQDLGLSLKMQAAHADLFAGQGPYKDAVGRNGKRLVSGNPLQPYAARLFQLPQVVIDQRSE